MEDCWTYYSVSLLKPVEVDIKLFTRKRKRIIQNHFRETGSPDDLSISYILEGNCLTEYEAEFTGRDRLCGKLPCDALLGPVFEGVVPGQSVWLECSEEENEFRTSWLNGLRNGQLEHLSAHVAFVRFVEAQDEQ